MLMENGIWEFVNQQQTLPTDATQLAAHTQRNMKSRRIILDVVNDHVIAHLFKKMAKEMWEPLMKLY